MAKTKVIRTEITTQKREHLVFDYLGEERRLALTKKVREYHNLTGEIPPGTEIVITRRLQEAYNGAIDEFFRLDKIIGVQ